MFRNRLQTYRVMIAASIMMGLAACANPGVSPTPFLTRSSEPTALPSTETPTRVSTDAATREVTRTATPSATPTPTVARSEESLADVLIKPLMNEANKRREKRASADPNYYRRVDRELNEGRINILLFGYGETHEPPVTERAYIGSPTIISYDTRTRRADVISITHDTRSPAVERKLGISGKPGSATRIDQAYRVGGFDLMREALGNATGLSIDFQISFDDVVIKDFVDGVFGGIEVTVPMAFEVHPFYLKGVKYPAGSFSQGRQKLNGTQVIQFIKTVPVAAVAYDVSLEHNQRKHLIFEALLESIKAKSSDPWLWLNLAKFTNAEVQSGVVAYDFDPNGMLRDQIGVVVSDLGRYVGKDKGTSARLPQIGKKLYIVDKKQGDGGIRWVDPNVDDPYMQADIRAGVYPHFNMEVPYYGNPYAPNLAEGYWTSTRSLVRNALLDRPKTEGQPALTEPPRCE